MHTDKTMQSTYDYLDLGQFRVLYNYVHDPRKMKFYIEGIKCSKCIAKIENLKALNEQVQTLEVDLANQTAVVELKSSESSFARVADEIAHLGFRPIPIQASDDTSEKWRQESRRDLIRLAVAGFCAGNIMFLAFSIYFGLDGSMKRSFEWLQFALYLPVVSFVAWPFYTGFLNGLKQRSISIDGPMAIASFIGFSFSTWNLFRGNGSIYFDSTSGFLFLILATRFFQKKMRFEYLKFLRPTALAETMKARLLKDGSWTWIRSDRLKAGDNIVVHQGEWIPADGKLLSPNAILDLSVLDGESLPRRLQNGSPVKAGSRLLSDAIEVNVIKSGADSLLGRLLSSVNSQSIADTEASKLSNKASQILLVTVLLIAAITLFLGFFGDFESYFEKSFALIVLACPCAMAFGTPLALSFSMKRAQENGIILKSAKTFEALSEIDTIFLDKTGTLTEKFWNLTNSSLSPIPSNYMQLILVMESKSQHPIAYALREIWTDIQISSDFKFDSITEIPSLGVQGNMQGKIFKFHHFMENSEKWFGLFEDDHLLWKFQLKSILQQDSLESIKKISQMGYKTFLLSGDKRSETYNIANELGICPASTYSELTPQMKELLVQGKPNSIMIGDGVNDALALKAAKVGIAVKGSIDVALKSADVLFLNSGINSLIELFRIADQARNQIRKNLKTALIYNTVGGIAALLGLINPFIAALLMPMSSIYILASTWWGTRK